MDTSLLLKLQARQRQIARQAARKQKRDAKNRHYRQCNIDRGISPKSFYRAHNSQ